MRLVKAVPAMTRDVQTRLSARDTLLRYFSCLLRETLLHSRLLAAVSPSRRLSERRAVTAQ